METTQTIHSYRNDSTGELAPPHRLGTDEDGATLYRSVEGWTPVDAEGNDIEVECDEDGNWTVGAYRIQTDDRGAKYAPEVQS